MRDKRNDVLSNQLINYSLDLKKGEVLYLEIKGKETIELAKSIIRDATKKGAIPFWFYNDESISRHWIANATKEQMEVQAQMHLQLMQRADAYIGVRGSDNPFDHADIDPEKMQQLQDHFYTPVHFQERVNRTRWVVLRYPNNAMAQLAQTSQEKFSDFYFDVCCADYGKMSKSMDKIVDMMESTDKVRIVAPGTDLSFSIKGIPAIKCDGKLNIPDGEVFTAPIRDSINGTISYNAPSMKDGVVYNNIKFKFKEGKIVEASCDGNTEGLNKILDGDEGARYIGEFALGVNPFVEKPMLDTLFDEKIGGSFHLTPGNCYDTAPNGNKSSLHWDLVSIQTKNHGGGEIWFDDKLVRKDGKFTDEALKQELSKENLRASVD